VDVCRPGGGHPACSGGRYQVNRQPYRRALGPVSTQGVSRPRDGVLHADDAWLRPDPRFQVLWPVVVPHAVSVMHRLIGKQIPPEVPLHLEYVLEDVSTRPCPRMIGRAHHHGACLVLRPAALRIAVEGSTGGATPRAGRRLHLFGRSTRIGCATGMRGIGGACLKARRTGQGS
jgi:hypothetical protein